MQDLTYDVVVVGAGPAGSVAAKYAALNGAKVIMIEKRQDIEVIAEAKNGLTAVRLAAEAGPDLVIMDVGMPDLNGIEATRRIVGKCPEVKVIALSMHDDKQFVTQMLIAGASGYVLKDCAMDELAHAIKAVLANRIYVSPAIRGIAVADYLDLGAAASSSAPAVLTQREQEVLPLLAHGRATKQIASELSVSPKTVETHRQNIMHKLDIYTVAELTKYAIRKGLVSLED